MLWPWWKLLIWTHNKLCINCTTIMNIDLLITLLESPWKVQFEFKCAVVYDLIHPVWERLSSREYYICHNYNLYRVLLWYACHKLHVFCHLWPMLMFILMFVLMRETVGPHPSMLWWSQFDSFNAVFWNWNIAFKICHWIYSHDQHR